MITKLFVGNLPHSSEENEVRAFFGTIFPLEEILRVTIIRDKMSGHSRGFGFIEIRSNKTSTDLIKESDGSNLNGRKLTVGLAHPYIRKAPEEKE